ncbi:hypothetical protein ACHAWC_009783 [Mediolabrus comicus]
MASSSSSTEPQSRRALRTTRRILIKAGTSVVANDDGRPSLIRLSAICEQIAELQRSGVQIIMVSSGATGMGKRLLRTKSRMSMSIAEVTEQVTNMMDSNSNSNLASLNEEEEHNYLVHHQHRATPPPHHGRSESLGGSMLNGGVGVEDSKKTFQSACAAGGQFEMMSLYNALFSQLEVSAAQVLLTESDFRDENHLTSLKYSIERLVNVGIIPIINENDAISAFSTTTNQDAFTDNDSLAALCARSFGCDMCILLTDVDGVFDRPPNQDGARLLPFYAQEQSVGIGEKSKHGRGGMASKIEAAQFAVSPGSQCRACVVVSGHDFSAIRAIASRDYDASEEEDGVTNKVPFAAVRDQARKLQSLPHSERKAILYAVAEALENEKDVILAANKVDLDNASKDGTSEQLVNRLKLTDAKIATLSSGIRQIADQDDPLGVVKTKRELTDGLVLSQVTVPIGVLMIIFESRPDSMPQISALALASGNGLLLKGGKEAARSNEVIHRVIGDAIEQGSGGKIKRDVIALVTSRGQVADLLKLDDVVDLVIPRGSNALVSYIKANTKIPVLGHADGVCHVYIDKSASDPVLVSDLVLDAKTDYPSACNAMETLLLHVDTLQSLALPILMNLRAAGVKCLGGPKAMDAGLCDVPAEEMKCEYGDLTCMVEIVDDMDEAIDHIHKYGSGHTEAIVCGDDSDAGREFLQRVDAACVFKNASTRFADGYRFGLGAEVGISTGRIHARGPVGVEGLLTVKWQLQSEGGISYVGQFAGGNPMKKYTHKELA